MRLVKTDQAVQHGRVVVAAVAVREARDAGHWERSAIPLDRVVGRGRAHFQPQCDVRVTLLLAHAAAHQFATVSYKTRDHAISIY